MSPIPPPAGTHVPFDDWSDDPSFDLSSTPHHIALPSSPSSSSGSSPRSRRSTTNTNINTNVHTSSPLRNSNSNSHIKRQVGAHNHVRERDDDEDDLDFDLPDSFAAPKSSHALCSLDLGHQPSTHFKPLFNPPSSSSSSSSSLRTLTKTVVGQGPTGIGTITKLGVGRTPSALPTGTVKAKLHAVARAWEMDIDFGDDDDVDVPVNANANRGAGSTRRLTLSPPKKGFMPDIDALDDLGFDLDEEEDKEATLKAGATIKALLPPPRSRSQSQPQSHAQLQSLSQLPPPPPLPVQLSTPPDVDQDALEAEADFVLPLNLTNLNLVSKPKSRPRDSVASNVTEWDSPSTSTSGMSTSASGSARKSISGWDSPSARGDKDDNKRFSEYSATSVSDGLADLKDKDKAKGKGRGGVTGDRSGDTEEDMESGLIVPSPTFFSSKRAKELNHILDKKRKPQYAPPTPVSRPGTGIDETFRSGAAAADESIEDGLVLNDPKLELSHHRLSKSRKARSANPPLAIKREGKIAPRQRETSWEKQREQGWRRATPPSGSGSTSMHYPVMVPLAETATSTKDRTQSSLGLTGLRSHSTSATGQQRRSETPLGTGVGRERDTPRSRSGQPLLNNAMPPPPLPPVPSVPLTPSRLRHQKSYHHMIAQSPNTLSRKQSLSSLQEAFASSSTGTLRAAPEHGPDTTSTSTATSSTSRYHNSTSRLTMPTSSSKAKARPPISGIFPRSEFNTSTSGSSISSIDSRRDQFGTTSHAGPSSGVGPFAVSAAPSGSGSIAKVKKRVMEIPRRSKQWGDGSELEGIEDLQVDGEEPKGKGKAGAGIAGIGLGKPSRRGHEPARVYSSKETEKRKKSGEGHNSSRGAAATPAVGSKKRTRKPALLIKHLGGVDKKKVVGDMTWNPTTLRWEGNESILRDFDNIPLSTSVRPALITHFSGSGIPSSSSRGVTSPTADHPDHTVLPGSGVGTVRIVGDMRFDPEKMCWVSLGEEEPDPFEGMADDEDEDAGGTIRANVRKLVAVGLSSSAGTDITESTGTGSLWDLGKGGGSGGGAGSRMVSEATTTASRAGSDWRRQSSISTSTSTSAADGEDLSGGGSQAITLELRRECREAEERHRKEMRGWIPSSSSSWGRMDSREREKEGKKREERRLWEIRNLAMKS